MKTNFLAFGKIFFRSEAVDPEGDRFTLTLSSEGTGFTTMMPQAELQVAYTAAGTEGSQPHSLVPDEAYDLYQALAEAPRNEDTAQVDVMAMGFLIADLRSRGGAGGACVGL